MADSCSCSACSCDSCKVETDNSLAATEKANHPWRTLWETERSMIIETLISLVLFAAALIAGERLGPLRHLAYSTLLLLSGWRVFLSALKSVAKGNGLDETFLMSIASIGALLIGEYPESIAVMLFYQIGELFQAQAVSSSRNAIAALVDMRPKMTHLIADASAAKTVRASDKLAASSNEVAAATVSVGSIILVRPGEQVPLDGIVLQGSSTLDTAFITGESLPRPVEAGDHVDAGCVNGNQPLVMETTSTYENSAIARILNLLKDSQAKKSSHELIIRRFARVYTPLVVGAAAIVGLVVPTILALPAVGVGSWTAVFYARWIHRALVFLVVSCPCALVITVPLTYFASLGAFAKLGVLIKGETYVEQLARAQAVLFDKTGTLTLGQFTVTRATILAPESDDEARAGELFALLGALESHSTHPLAQSAVAYALARCTGPTPALERVEELPGRGIKGSFEGQPVYVGNAAFMRQVGAEPTSTLDDLTREASGTLIFLCVNSTIALALELSDTIKTGAPEALSALKEQHLTTVMLTGDEDKAARATAALVGVDEVRARLLPSEKVDAVAAFASKTSKTGGATVFCGDGINDAPSLARADVGIAMGGLGSDAAIQAADVVLTHDDIAMLPRIINTARRTVFIAKENIIIALGVKALILLLALVGYASMWAAVFADVGVTMLLIFNALRVLRVKGENS